MVVVNDLAVLITDNLDPIVGSIYKVVVKLNIVSNRLNIPLRNVFSKDSLISLVLLFKLLL